MAWMVHGTNCPLMVWTVHSTNTTRYELSMNRWDPQWLPYRGTIHDETNYGTFAPKNFRSRERKYHGMELSFPGTFAHWNFRSCSLEPSLPETFAPGSKIPRTFAPMPSDFWSRVATFVHGYVCICGCIRVLIFVIQRPHIGLLGDVQTIITSSTQHSLVWQQS